MRKEKEKIMTNVLTNLKDFLETEEIQISQPNPRIETIRTFLKVKSATRRLNKKIVEYTERRKEIRNGQTVLKGTRITTKEIFLIMSENEKGQNVYKYISEQYPSIDSEEKIFYGALYEIRKTNSLLFILRILFSK